MEIKISGQGRFVTKHKIQSLAVNSVQPRPAGLVVAAPRSGGQLLRTVERGVVNDPRCGPGLAVIEGYDIEKEQVEALAAIAVALVGSQPICWPQVAIAAAGIEVAGAVTADRHA